VVNFAITVSSGLSFDSASSAIFSHVDESLVLQNPVVVDAGRDTQKCQKTSKKKKDSEAMRLI
jgi:hypothetical protein